MRSRAFAVAVLAALCLSIRLAGGQQAPQSSSAENYAGVYQLSRGRSLYIQPWPSSGRGDDAQGGEQLVFADDAGTLRALYPLSRNRFAAGPGWLERDPQQFEIEFVPDARGQITKLAYRKSGRRSQTASRLSSYKQETVRFPSGKETLAGTLLLPPGKGPHPVLVLIHGTGATDRYTVFPIVQFLLSHGMALFGYDKRGVGESSGDWHAASVDDFAADTIAAVDFLKARKDIDPRRIGLFGASQGGWIAPLAASRSSDIGYVITISGPAISPAAVDQDLLERALQAHGFSEKEIGRALDFLRLRDAAIRDERTMEPFRAALRQAGGETWFAYASVPKSVDGAVLAHWRRFPLDYDPAPAIAKLQVPVLAIFGELDQTVVPRKNAAAWQAALDNGRVKDSEIKIFPGANHMLLEARTGSNEELPGLGRFTPRYMSFLLDWLRRHSILRK